MQKSYKGALGAAAAVVLGGVVIFANVMFKEDVKPSQNAVVKEDASKDGGGIEHGEDDPADIAKDFTVSYEGIKTDMTSVGLSVHDPSIFKDGDKYYIYGSHQASAVSSDLKEWANLFHEEYATNAVFEEIVNDDKTFVYSGRGDSAISTDDGGLHIWAPDMIYNKAMKKYCLYFCTSSTYMSSNLAFATSDSAEGPFRFQKAFIYSGYNGELLDKTDVLDYVDKDYVNSHYIELDGEGGYDNRNYPNAIDPTVFYDKDGKLWMVYGSWSGGIFLLELDENTGEPIHPEADEANDVDPYYGKRLLGGGHTSIEGPYILYDENTDYYYLFVSYGGLAQKGGYQIRVFRSKDVDGEYVDMSGKRPMIGTGNPAFTGLKLSGNYRLPGLTEAYMATGHNSAFVDDKDNKSYIVYHTRFENRGEYHEPRVHQYIANEEGWPCMLPYSTDGETVSEEGYDTDKVVGMYYVINQGMKVNAEIAEPIMLQLTAKGNVYGNGITGTWDKKDGSCYMSITYDDKEYKGVFCEMNDEAGAKVMTFSAVGSNESVWGVKYEQK